MTPIDVLSFVGFCAVICSSTVGGYILCRWGYTGAAMIFRARHTLDVQVREEAEQIVLSK